MGGQYRSPTLSAPSRKEAEREMDDPEGNLVIGERVVHESQRHFPYWEHSWVGTAHKSHKHFTQMNRLPITLCTSQSECNYYSAFTLAEDNFFFQTGEAV
jgi:hypothetical protein